MASGTSSKRAVLKVSVLVGVDVDKDKDNGAGCCDCACERDRGCCDGGGRGRGSGLCSLGGRMGCTWMVLVSTSSLPATGVAAVSMARPVLTTSSSTSSMSSMSSCMCTSSASLAEGESGTMMPASWMRNGGESGGREILRGDSSCTRTSRAGCCAVARFPACSAAACAPTTSCPPCCDWGPVACVLRAWVVVSSSAPPPPLLATAALLALRTSIIFMKLLAVLCPRRGPCTLSSIGRTWRAWTQSMGTWASPALVRCILSPARLGIVRWRGLRSSKKRKRNERSTTRGPPCSKPGAHDARPVMLSASDASPSSWLPPTCAFFGVFAGRGGLLPRALLAWPARVVVVVVAVVAVC
ncbi:hypothetical protein BD289DRAFT_446812 [Coniella lustricola]|uniref:Uncharacterized protein n=1 Tax=Coniella lustricola TaxID=2025994 RepID=A0A2T2ZTM0_9PEZI|nr:hypothetical protein BD289DRAFT_446812 [Coniella lustricola]